MSKRQRMATLNGGFSTLLIGDPDYKKYGDKAIPMLLAEGWTVHSISPGSGTQSVVVLNAPDTAESRDAEQEPKSRDVYDPSQNPDAPNAKP